MTVTSYEEFVEELRRRRDGEAPQMSNIAIYEMARTLESRSSHGHRSLLLDIGCGPSKAPGHIGLDHHSFPGVDVVRDIRRGLPFDDDSFDGVRMHHCLEHFGGEDLLFLVNEVWRVVRPGGILEITVPDATSPNRYRDPTHLTRDWSEDSFMLWEVNDKGEWPIFVGPSYDRRAKLRRLTTAVNPNRDRLYRMEVVK